MTDVLRDGSPYTNEYPKLQVSSKTAKIAKRIKKEKYLNGNLSQNTNEFPPKNTPFCHDFKSRVCNDTSFDIDRSEEVASSTFIHELKI